MKEPRKGTNAERLLKALRQAREEYPTDWWMNPQDWGLNMTNPQLIAAQRHLRKLGHDVCAHIEFTIKETTT